MVSVLWPVMAAIRVYALDPVGDTFPHGLLIAGEVRRHDPLALDLGFSYGGLAS